MAGVHQVDSAAMSAIARAAANARIPSYVISPGDGPRGFHDAVRAVFPLDPPLVSSRSADAVADSMWGGIDGLGVAAVVVLWPDSAVFERRSPAEFSIARAILSELVQSLSKPEFTRGNPTSVSVYLEGKARD